MCLLAFQWQTHPTYPFILVANRDEAYNRSSSRLHYWKDAPSVLAGRDLSSMGTWLGITKSGRFAGITNQPFSDWPSPASPISRGKLVRDFLESDHSPVTFGVRLKETRQDFKGYRLLFGDLTRELFLYENTSASFKKIIPGIHSLSSDPGGRLSEKRKKSEYLLSTYTNEKEHLDPVELASLFHDTEPASDVSLLAEKMTKQEAQQLSSIFVEAEQFGTVSTAVILMDKNGKLSFLERKYNKKGMHHDTIKTLTV